MSAGTGAMHGGAGGAMGGMTATKMTPPPATMTAAPSAMTAAQPQSVMKACAAAWNGMSAADKAKTTYKAYSATCMKNHGPSVAATGAMSPTDRMKACAAQWNSMKKAGTTGGQTYAQFTSKCLKKS